MTSGRTRPSTKTSTTTTTSPTPPPCARQSLDLNISLLFWFMALLFFTWAEITKSALRWVWLAPAALSLGIVAAYLLSGLIGRAGFWLGHEPPPTAEPEKTDFFKNTVIVMLTLISVFAALVTFLQNHASLRSSDLAAAKLVQRRQRHRLVFPRRPGRRPRHRRRSSATKTISSAPCGPTPRPAPCAWAARPTWPPTTTWMPSAGAGRRRGDRQRPAAGRLGQDVDRYRETCRATPMWKKSASTPCWTSRARGATRPMATWPCCPRCRWRCSSPACR